MRNCLSGYSAPHYTSVVCTSISSLPSRSSYRSSAQSQLVVPRTSILWFNVQAALLCSLSPVGGGRPFFSVFRSVPKELGELPLCRREHYSGSGASLISSDAI